MGCAVALRLAQAGLRPLVLERAIPGAEASTAAAGILGPSIEAKSDGPFLRLGLESRERHAALAAELLEEHGVDVGFRRWGLLRVAYTDAELTELRGHAATLDAIGIRAQLHSAEDTRRLEPACHEEVVGSLELPEEAQLEPKALLPALALAAARAGATFRTGATVHGVRAASGRVRGVEVDGGLLEADAVVVCAGSWTSLIPGLSLPSTTIHPVRGQIVETHSRPPLFRRIVFGAGGYVVTRPDGRMLCGSTEEHVGFRREVTFEGLTRVLATARRIAPGLADAPVLGHWSSFRPGTSDDLPLIGETSTAGLYVASGHYRNGILLSAITADLVRELVVGAPRRAILDAVDPKRFGSPR